MKLLIDPASLRRTRLLAGLTQKDLAAKVGVHPITFTRYETGTMAPRPGTVRRIARALGVQITDIARVSDE